MAALNLLLRCCALIVSYNVQINPVCSAAALWSFAGKRGIDQLSQKFSTLCDSGKLLLGNKRCETALALLNLYVGIGRTEKGKLKAN
jgi:hypothetical protein